MGFSYLMQPVFDNKYFGNNSGLGQYINNTRLGKKVERLSYYTPRLSDIAGLPFQATALITARTGSVIEIIPSKLRTFFKEEEGHRFGSLTVKSFYIPSVVLMVVGGVSYLVGGVIKEGIGELEDVILGKKEDIFSDFYEASMDHIIPGS